MERGKGKLADLSQLSSKAYSPPDQLHKAAGGCLWRYFNCIPGLVNEIFVLVAFPLENLYEAAF